MNLKTTSPRTGQTKNLDLSDTPAGTVQDIVAGVARASERLSKLGREARAQLLDGIANKLEGQRESLVQITDFETALGEARLNGELSRTIYQLREFAAIVRKGTLFEAIIDHPSESPMGPKPDLRRMLHPIGPVAVFGASNFPYAFGVCGGDTSSAIAAGNSVVVKAHSSHLETSMALFECMREAFVDQGFEASAVGIVYGQEAARALIEAEAIAAVGFTGSVHGGRFLFDIAQSRPNPIPFYGELGSVNPLIVTPAAAANRGDQIAVDYAASITLGGGQFCTKPGLIFVPKSSADAFRKKSDEQFTATQPTWLLNKSTFDSYEAATEELAKNPIFIDKFESQVQTNEGFSVKPKLFWSTLADIRHARDIMYTECFGPMAIAIEYENLDEVVVLLKDMPGALAAAIHGEESEADSLRDLVDVLSDNVGRIMWNGYPTGVAVSWAQTHGGPYPASTSSLHTSVGATAIRRFMRPVTYQSMPEALLPIELREVLDPEDQIPRVINTQI